MSARTLARNELTGAHLSMHQWARASARADTGKFQLRDLSWAEIRAGWMSGLGAGWLPAGWVGMGVDAIYGRGAQGSLTSCDETDHAAACDADLGEYYDHRTPWFSNGIGGSCSRTVTCLDYTSSCSHLDDPTGDPGWNPDGTRACNVNSEEHGSACAADFVRWEYVPDDIANPSGGGQCQEVWSCSGNACNSITRGGFMNAQTRSVEIEKTQTCQGCDELPMRVTFGPELDDDSVCCANRDPMDTSIQPVPVSPLPDNVSIYVSNQSVRGGHWVLNCERKEDVEQVLKWAYGLFLANADIVRDQACKFFAPLSDINPNNSALDSPINVLDCFCKLLNAGDPVHIVSRPTGSCLQFGDAVGPDYLARWGYMATDAVTRQSGGYTEITFYLGWMQDSQPTTLLRAVSFGAGNTSQMMDLVALLAHELSHVCGYVHTDMLDLKDFQDKVASALKARYEIYY